MALLSAIWSSYSALAAGLIWPTNQLLPTFSAPAATIDCIDMSGMTDAEIDLFASVQGIVNRSQPRIACVHNVDGEGKMTWLDLHNLPYVVTNGYGVIQKYRTNFTGLVVTDPNQPDTLNLATTIAGVSNQLICAPTLLSTLTNAPYNFSIGEDLRGRFTDKFQIYGYLYSNYWSQCTHRLMTGLYTNLHGNLRDYVVAVKSACVWLDPATLNFSDKALLQQFVADMPANKSIYIGWWPSEGNGLNWIAQYGIPVLASDYLRNGSLFSGVTRAVDVPEIPPAPPLQNKVYVSLILSDGDNIQYMQHVMKMRWGSNVRGTLPIGWTVTPVATEMDPVMMNYYWSTATTNDCLISGPSGAGYTHMQNWNPANLAGFARNTDSYLQRSGVRIITIWDQVTTGVARAFATNCPTLLGLTDQSGGNYTSVNLGLRTMGLAVSYSSSVASIISGITNAAASWSGTAPMFMAAQANTWDLTPTDLQTIANALDPNKYVVVRPDHLFMLYNRLFAKPQAVTEAPKPISATSVGLRAIVTPNATNTAAWFEWGTNSTYTAKTSVTLLNSGTTATQFNAAISGLVPGRTYHYRVVASNALGMVWGADRLINTGGRVQAWGNTTLGETNVPPGLTNVMAISAGATHALVLQNNGQIIAWGQNSFGQTNVPAGLSGVVEVAGGLQHSVALKSDGTVAAWGDNSVGQTNVPANLTNIIAIAAGGYHSLALKSDQTVAAWGQNNFGQTNVPAGLSNVVRVAAGFGHSVALKADGTVTAWGYNAFGQANVPAGLNSVVGVAAGQYHSVALKADGVSPANFFPARRWVADSLTGADGTSIATWTDSVAGRVAVQPTAARQPQLFVDAGTGRKVVRFDNAASQFLTVPASNSPVSSAANFSLVVVFKTTTPGDASNFFYENTGLLGAEQPNAVPDWALGLSGPHLAGGLGAGLGGCGADLSMVGGNVTDGRFHVAMYVRSGSVALLYVDGVIVAEQNGLCTAARGNYDFQIGAMTTVSHFFDGDIAEVQIYDRALNLAEIPAVTQTLATGYEMAGVAGTVSARWIADTLIGSDGMTISNWTDAFNGKTATQNSVVNRPRLYSNVINGHKVLRFSSASSQYLTVPAVQSPISSAGSFALVMVFKTSTPGASSSSFYFNTGLIGCEQSGVVPDWAFCLNSTQLGAGLGGGTGGCGADLGLYGGLVTDGNPHIAMYVRTGETISLYVDGVRVATQTGLCSGARGNYNFQIGAMTAGTLCFNGDIAEIQMYNRALSPWEITSINENLAVAYGIGGAAGTVVAWGSNSNGQTNAPKTLTNLTAVASGSAFNLALRANGTVTGWGNNAQVQTTIPLGLTNVSAIAGGASFALALGNIPPLASNVVVSGFVDHDLLITLPVSNPDSNPLTYRISNLPLAGQLYQSIGGVRGAAINTPNATVSDAFGQLIFATEAGQTNAPYASFNFSVEDGLFASSAGTVTVNVTLPNAPQVTGVAWDVTTPGAENFQLNFAGSTAAAYSVWASTNLLDWERLGAALEAAAGQYQFSDYAATNWSQRFYRISAGQ